jgi:putative hydrolase of the HAD superfamily
MLPFRIVSDRLQVPFVEMVSIGDRVAVDLELPIENGMGGILIECIADVYELPNVLS